MAVLVVILKMVALPVIFFSEGCILFTVFSLLILLTLLRLNWLFYIKLSQSDFLNIMEITRSIMTAMQWGLWLQC